MLRAEYTFRAGRGIEQACAAPSPTCSGMLSSVRYICVQYTRQFMQFVAKLSAARGTDNIAITASFPLRI